MEACAVICRKATVALPDANYLSSRVQNRGFCALLGFWTPRFRGFRAQNRGFCAFLGFGTLVFRHFEHKIGVFVLFWPLEPSFSGFSSTKSGFLCFFGLRNPSFQVFRAQNWHFCALVIETLASGNRKARKFFVFARF